jgi:peptide/nickel transport system substrate-binding protein
VTRHLLWPTILALLGIVLSFFILFRVAASQLTVEVPAEGGTYAEGVLGYSDAINPILLASANSVDRDLSALVFNGLTALDETGRLQPALATEWEISPDGTVYDFKLRRGVTWHDGFPFTAADVVFTVQALQDPDFQGDPVLHELWRNVTVEATGDYSVRFTLQEPFIPFINYTTVGVLPSHLLSDIPAAELPRHEFSTRRPVGTGMYKVESVGPDRVMLVRNPSYWGRSPFLDRIELRSFGDWDSLLAAYDRGEIQGIARVPPEHLADLDRMENAQLYSARSAGYTMMYLNLQRPSASYFQDKSVRQALLYALDRQGLVDDILGGQGIVADSPILPGTWAYDASVRRYDYDPELATTLLEDAGWTDTDGDRIRDKDGITMTFTLLTGDDPASVQLGEAIAEQWRTIGVDATAKSVGSRLVQDYIQPRDYDAALVEVGLTADPDPYPWWHSTQMGDGGQNYSGFSNEEADMAMEEARAITDSERRTQLYQQFQEIFAEEVPALVLYYPIYSRAVDSQVKGVQLSPLFFGSDRFRNLSDWYTETRETVVTPAP